MNKTIAIKSAILVVFAILAIYGFSSFANAKAENQHRKQLYIDSVEAAIQYRHDDSIAQQYKINCFKNETIINYPQDVSLTDSTMIVKTERDTEYQLNLVTTVQTVITSDPKILIQTTEELGRLETIYDVDIKQISAKSDAKVYIVTWIDTLIVPVYY